MTVFRWAEKVNRDFDTAYSEQVVLEVNKVPLGVTSGWSQQSGTKPAPSGEVNLKAFLSGVKAEHK